MNKRETLFEHVNKINHVLDFIGQNLEDDLSLQQMAKLACMSPFHFHRVFSSLVGETLHEFVNRKRLEKIATHLLKYPSITIQELGLTYGYDNSVSFARAFKKFYGMSATEMRRQSKGRFNQIIKEVGDTGKPVISIEKYIEESEELLEWTSDHANIERTFLPETKLAYIRHTGAIEAVGESFVELKHWAAKTDLLLQEEVKWYLLVHDNPAVTEIHKMQQSACLQIPSDFDTGNAVGSLTLPGGAFLVGSFFLKNGEFKKAWDAMSIWMMDRDLRAREGHYIEIFYTDSLFHPDKQHEVDICIPVD